MNNIKPCGFLVEVNNETGEHTLCFYLDSALGGERRKLVTVKSKDELMVWIESKFGAGILSF
jgi:hypothetical protein